MIILWVLLGISVLTDCWSKQIRRRTKKSSQSTYQGLGNTMITTFQPQTDSQSQSESKTENMTEPSTQEKKGTFQIHYFSTASTYTHKTTETLPAPLPLSQLFPLLESKYPGITEKVLGSCAVSLGVEYVDPSPSSSSVSGDTGGDTGVVIKDGDEVGIIPPVSSG